MAFENIKRIYSKQREWSTEFKKFTRFRNNNSLIELLKDAKGPYPAGHGKDHVKKVIEIIDSLSSEKNNFGIKDIFNLLVSIYIHDLAMIHMIPTGPSGHLAEKARNIHSYEKNLKEIIKKYNILDTYYGNREEYIIKLASAHANDSEKTVEEKLEQYKNHLELNEEKNKWEGLVRLICIADYLDLGINRLRYSDDIQEWDEIQKGHSDKHKYLSSPKISNNVIIVTLTADAEEIVKDNTRELKERLEILTIVQKVYFELEKHVKNLNEALETEWTLRPLNEDFFGRIFPLSYGIQLHTIIFEKAYNEKSKDNFFEIDMLGHSLFTRFVKNEENLNGRIFKILENEKTRIRILLLDPDIELQQSSEIYDSQLDEKNDRYILPLYDQNFELVEDKKGDILNSLDKIVNEWQNVSVDSLLKVKLTKKILYSSITRYGNHMIVTPYTMGLSSHSISIVYSKESPIYYAFLKEFELIWNKKDETRLYLNKVGNRINELNPIKDITPDVYQNNKQSNFNYENWLLGEKFRDRIKFWFESENILIPPYELEIQPSNNCNLECSYCIGRHLEHFNNIEKRGLKISDLESIKTILEWEYKGFKINRIRISGLNGDPLSDDALEFTKALINRNHIEFNKDIVLFTNGLNIDKVQKELLKIDTVHISIDAGTSETFMEIKNSNSLEKIFNEILKLKAKKIEQNAKTKIGIGFVVTQRNYKEVDILLEKANNIGVDFVRFKRDIQLPNSISWRVWIETKSKINELKINYPKIDNIFITDLPRQHWNGKTKECLSYRFSLTIGPDGNIFTCDHLTNNPNTSLANLSDKDLINSIKVSLKNKDYCNKLKKCSQCPPFNFRFNYFMPQLKSLYVNGKWGDLDKKINTYLSDI